MSDYRDRRAEKSSRFTDGLMNGVRSGALTSSEASRLAGLLEDGTITTRPGDNDMRIPASTFMAFIRARARQRAQPGIQPNPRLCAGEKESEADGLDLSPGDNL